MRGLEFDELRTQAAKYCHGSARSNSDHPATLAKSADVAKRGRPSRSTASLLSSAGIPIEDIAHLVGHANTRTTEKVYRKELRRC